MTLRAYPDRIKAATAPGGQVVRTYSLEGSIVLEQIVSSENPDVLGELAFTAAQAADDEVSRTGTVFLACYDGDTGELLFESAEVLQ